MSLDKIRRISIVLMALVLAVGLATQGTASPDAVVKSDMTVASDMSSDMAMPTDVAMSKDTPMRGKCNGCAGDEKGIASGACSALCGTVIPSSTVAPVLYAVPVELLNPMSEARVLGRSYPPDPHPPRTTILS